VSLLCVASSEVDAGAVSFSNLIQNEMGAQGMQTVLTQGGCIAGVTAIEFVAQALELGAHEYAVVVAVDVPSRHFNRARNHVRDSTDKNCAPAVQTHIEDHYTRWLLSDGAGAFLLCRTPQAKEGVSLKLNWIHQKSFAGDFSLNLQSIEGICAETADLNDETRKQAQAAALALRTSSRLIPHLIDICIEEYRQLVESSWLQPAQLGHFLCQYSSEKFTAGIEAGFSRARLEIPSYEWFKPFLQVGHGANQSTNTGAATIYVMLAEIIQKKKLRSGEKILCLVPDLENMSVAFMQLEVEAMT
jgi:3-oxoacyl-[acyl-carrier-protein] synthase-3